MEIVNAIAIKDESKFDALDLPSQDIQIEYRITTPFMVKAYDDEDEKKDVVIRGPVYVGNEDMLDRHNELVDYEALDKAWDKYAKNPVILYNHSKTYGVIGRMTNFAMEDYEDYGMVPVGTAEIDSGEKDIVRKIRKGMLKAFSIGFVAKAAVKVCEDKDEDCYIKFTEIDWVETSVVDVPASPGALFGVEKKFSFLDSTKKKGCGCGCDGEKKSQTCDCPEGECKDPENCIGVDTSEDVVTSGEKNSNEKEQVGTDIFTTEEEALARAEELGCSGSHSMVNDEGQTLYMPCSSHDDYESSTGDEPQENTLSTDSVKNPLTHSHESPEEQKMSEEVTEIVEEEVVEEAVPTEEAPIELSESTEEVVTKSEDEAEASEEEVADEEPAEEEVEEEAVEEEAVEEEADEEADDDGEKSIDASPVAVLMEVVTVLKDLDARIAGMEASVTATEELSAEVESLKAVIAERDETIATLTTEKQVAEEEAALEAEVSKRVAEKLASMGVEAESPAPAQRKSVSTADPNPLPVVKTGVTKFDPTPNVSPGMNGLARWLEANISGNRS